MTDVKLISFAYKGARRPKADLVLDCRDLRNPHNHSKLRTQTGLMPEVQRFVKADPAYLDMVGKAFFEVQKAHPSVIIGFGCVGGRHRSVAMAELVGEVLRKTSHNVQIEHWSL